MSGQTSLSPIASSSRRARCDGAGREHELEALLVQVGDGVALRIHDLDAVLARFVAPAAAQLGRTDARMAQEAVDAARLPVARVAGVHEHHAVEVAREPDARAQPGGPSADDGDVEQLLRRARAVPPTFLAHGGVRGQERFRAHVPQRAGRHEVEQAKRRPVRRRQRERRGLPVHHAGGIARVVEAEGVPHLVAHDALDHRGRQRMAGAVVHRDR